VDAVRKTTYAPGLITHESNGRAPSPHLLLGYIESYTLYVDVWGASWFVITHSF